MGSEWGFLDIVGMILPWLFVPLIILLPLALWLRSRLLIGAVCLGALLFVFTYGHLYLPACPARASGPTFTVMSYNILFSTTQAEPILAEIERHDPDILGLQELQPPKKSAITQRLAQIYPYRSVEMGRGFFSRYPIEACETLFSEGKISGWVQRCVLQVDGRPLVVYNLHARPPLVVLSQPLGLPVALDTGKHGWDLHTALALVEETNAPVIVMGDFNMSDRHAPYQEFRHSLSDAFQERGWGMGFTYTRFRGIDLPTWRIDYIFHSDELVALRAWMGDFSTSDHRPLLARLGFAGE